MEVQQDLALALSRGLQLEAQCSSRDSLQCSSGYSTQSTTPCCSEDTIPSQGECVWGCERETRIEGGKKLEIEEERGKKQLRHEVSKGGKKGDKGKKRGEKEVREVRRKAQSKRGKKGKRGREGKGGKARGESEGRKK